MRCGGLLTDCFYTENTVQYQFGYKLNALLAHGTMRGNVAIAGVNQFGDAPRATKFTGIDPVLGAICEYNIAANTTDWTGSAQLAHGWSADSPIDNFLLRDSIVYNWGSTNDLRLTGDPVDYANIRVEDCDIQRADGSYNFNDRNAGGLGGRFLCKRNRFFKGSAGAAYRRGSFGDLTFAEFQAEYGDGSDVEDQAIYPNPDRNVDDYAVSIGLADRLAYFDGLRLQERGNWDADYSAASIVAYFRANFGMVVP
jgi:hypothetical protein